MRGDVGGGSGENGGAADCGTPKQVMNFHELFLPIFRVGDLADGFGVDHVLRRLPEVLPHRFGGGVRIVGGDVVENFPVGSSDATHVLNQHRIAFAEQGVAQRIVIKEKAALLEQRGIPYGTYLWDPRYKGLDDYIWGCLCGPK